MFSDHNLSQAGVSRPVVPTPVVATTASHARRSRLNQRKFMAFGAVALCLMLGACPEDSASTTDTTDADTLPGNRTFLLAARAESYDPTLPRPFVPSLASLTFGVSTADPISPPVFDRPIEALVLPVDLIGIPWSSFSGPDNRPASLPSTWLAEIERLEALAAEAGLPLILSLSPLSPDHNTLAPLASEQSGALVLNPTWKPSCYDPSADSNPTLHRDQYAGFVVWLAERFRPAAILVGQRLNLYEANCGTSAFKAVVGFVNHAQTRLSTLATRPLTVASMDVEDLYGFPSRPGRCVTSPPKECLDTRATLLSDLTVDRLGLDSSPWRAFGDLADVPRDWLAAVADAQTLPALVASTGAPAMRMDAVRGACSPFIESDELAQRNWLDQAIGFSASEEAPFLVWRALIDQLPTAILAACPCQGDIALCTHLEGLGNRRDDRRAMLGSGLTNTDGTPRQAMTLWRSLLATP
jgi:hypothetical protein